jgi:aminopeptidase N
MSMRAVALSLAFLLSTSALAAAPARAPGGHASAIIADADAPKGKLPHTATPRAYRLSFDIDPDRSRFFGHDEIDVTLNEPTQRLYMHGRDLNVALAAAKVGGATIPAKYTQVDKTGVVRLDFARSLPAGPATLVFDYDAQFGDSASGMFRVRVGGKWYGWTQFESIDARAAFPGFDEPGFKTPFTVSVLSKTGDTVVTNSREISATPVKVDPNSAAAKYARAHGAPVPGPRVLHRFETTRPLPTYLVAIDTGPFVHKTGEIAPDAERSTPMPYGAVATQAQADKMGYVMAETPRIVSLLENYFGEPFPFPKLDQIGTPVMPGAMENAGADTYGDGIIFLPPGATTGDKQTFGMVVSHELSHQWFGDLVTPAWWDDIWLNESFANWMGYRIGNEWRPELNIGVGAIDEGFGAMNTDALIVGRPIHQPIVENSQIDSAFDSITYGKGGQVVAMIAAYLGDERFKQGVRLHLRRHAYGNATSEQFFQSIADAAQDPKLLAAFKSFVDQQGVPVLDIRRDGSKLVVTQARYAFLGSNPPLLTWTIPFCVRAGAAKSCSLLDQKVTTLDAPGSGTIMPNVGGTGYYRFDLQPDDWKALIASSAQLSPGEALATTDSLWASFRAGKAPAEWLIDEARTMAANPSATASADPGERLSGLRLRGLIASQSEQPYRSLVASIYGPRLSALGFDPAFGAHANDTPDRQKVRQQLVELLAFEAHDAVIRAKLKSAAEKYLAGDSKALDPAFRPAALTVVAADGGLPAAKMLVEKALSSEDPMLREAALGAAASSGHADVANYLLGITDKRLRSFDRLALIFGIARTPETREFGGNWILANYDKLATGNGIFFASRLPSAFNFQCGVEESARIEKMLGPSVRKAGTGLLQFQRTVEQIRNCGILKQAKGAEIAAALKSS